MNLRATITLVMAAVVMVSGIFAINALTRPIIEQRENNKYSEVIPESIRYEVYQPTTTLPSLIQNIDFVDAGSRGDILSYQVTFKGWSDGIEATVFVHADRLEIVALEINSHNETAGIGDRLLENTDFLSQFNGGNGEQVLSLGIDSLAGVSAPVTLAAVEKAIQDVLSFHQQERLGVIIVPEIKVEEDTSPPVVQILARPTTFNEGDIEPDWASYFVVTNEEDTVDVSIDRGTLDMNTASSVPYVITATFTDASGNVSTVTLQVTILPSEEIIEVVITPPSQERSDLFSTLYSEATLLNETTAQNVLAESMTNMYRIEQSETLLVMAYESLIDGFYNDSIRMIVFVTPGGLVDQIVVISNQETRSYGGNLIADKTFIAAFNQTSLTTAPEVDTYTGATITRDAIVGGVTSVLTYHQETFTE